MDSYQPISQTQVCSPTQLCSPPKKRRLEIIPEIQHSYPLTPKERLHILYSVELCQLFDGHSEHLLFNTQAGEIQRNIDVQHLNDLKQFQKMFCEKNGYYSFCTQIVIAEHDEKYALVDGQHRLETIRYLLDTDFERASNIIVPVLVVQLSCINEYDEVFIAINKNKPVMLYKHVYEWKNVGKHLEQYFRTHYYCYLKSTLTPQVPHLNVQALLSYIDEGNYIQKLGFGVDKWIKEIEELNACYRLHWRELLLDTRYITNVSQWVEKCESKQPIRPLYLGMFRKFEWVDRIVLKETSPDGVYLRMQHVPINYRVKIKKPLRRAVWRKRNTDSIVGICYACNQSLHYDNFECGHIVSVFSGGPTTVENLEPVCRMCNADMGIEHLEEFKKSLALMHQE